jgi:predicted CoA-binding protein
MEGEACPMPTNPSGHDRDVIVRMLAARTIAVVGLSDDPGRTSNHVGSYLQDAGYRILPVNPNCSSALGEKCVASLAELKERADVVLVFRRSEFTPEIAEQAVAAGAKGLWLQVGIHHVEAKRIAENAGLDYIEDRCMMVEHMKRKKSELRSQKSEERKSS